MFSLLIVITTSLPFLTKKPLITTPVPSTSLPQPNDYNYKLGENILKNMDSNSWTTEFWKILTEKHNWDDKITTKNYRISY